MIAVFDLILLVVVLIVFLGVFIRLGQIRELLKLMASHQGAIKPEEEKKSFFRRFDEAPL